MRTSARARAPRVQNEAKLAENGTTTAAVHIHAPRLVHFETPVAQRVRTVTSLARLGYGSGDGDVGGDDDDDGSSERVRNTRIFLT